MAPTRLCGQFQDQIGEYATFGRRCWSPCSTYCPSTPPRADRRASYSRPLTRLATKPGGKSRLKAKKNARSVLFLIISKMEILQNRQQYAIMQAWTQTRRWSAG
jgi:hypothetical protein